MDVQVVLAEVIEFTPDQLLARDNPELDLTAAITAEIERAISTLGGNPDTLDLTDT